MSRAERRPSSRRRDQRGAAALVVSLSLVMIVPMVAIVVDLGMQRVARRDMQSLADAVALDLAREINGRTQAQLAGAGSTGSPSSAASRSIARNDDKAVGDGVDVVVDWGSYVGGTWNTTTDPPSAVKVVASTDVDYSFTGGGGDVSRTAYANASSTACYRLGSWTAAVRSGDSTVLAPFNDLLGVKLDLASYQGLANADVVLSDLAAHPRIGSPARLLGGSVTYADLVTAMIDVLSNESTNNTVAIKALRTALGASGTIGTINVRDALNISPSDTAALAANLSVLDVLASVVAADGVHALSIPNLQAGVPGIGNQFTGALNLIAGAGLACGAPNTTASAATNTQIAGTMGIDFINLPSLNLGGGLGTLQTSKGVGALVVDIGKGTGQLIDPPKVYCGSGTSADPHTMSVRTEAGLANLRLTSTLDVGGQVKLDILGVKGLKVDVEIGVQIVLGGGPLVGSGGQANLRIPPNDRTPVSTGGQVLLDPSLVTITKTSVKASATVLGVKVDVGEGLLQPVINGVLSGLTSGNNNFLDKTLRPFVANVNTELVGPAARMAGLRLAGVDTYAVSAVCALPSLVG